MVSAAIDFLQACWQILAEAAPYVLFGFFAAGLLKALLPEDVVARHLGRRSVGAVLKASLLGIPLPLCSCGVIPAAISLRRQGANKGASAAFLVSTPESGIDSIAITWALLDPIMPVVRPLAAFLTATVAGLLINALPEESTSPDTPAPGGCQDGCATAIPSNIPLTRRLRAGPGYAFRHLLGDLDGHLLLRLGGGGAEMRRTDDVGQVEQRAFLRRFGGEHVEGGAGDVAGLERLGDCSLVHQSAARAID